MKTIDLASSLRLGVSAVYKALRKNMAAGEGLSMTVIETVGLLGRHQRLLPSELAEMTHVTLPSMSQMLSQMEQMGIIVKTPMEEDRRKVYISLTDEGRARIERSRYEREEWLKEAIDETLTEKEKELLAKAIPLLHKIVNKK